MLVMNTICYQKRYKLIKNIWLVAETRLCQYRTDGDSAWKNILHAYFQEGMELFFPALTACVDWTQPIVFLDGELQKISMDTVTGRRIADVLVKVACKEKGVPWLLLHFEVQGTRVKNFARRVYTYHARIADRYHFPVLTAVIFTDHNARWRPDLYQYSICGLLSLEFTYPAVKLSTYESDRSLLEQSDNPFAIVILTHLTAMRAHHNHRLRVESKILLMQHIYSIAKKYTKEREWVQHLINFIDFIFPLAGEDAVKYHHHLIKVEEETHMTYIESLERMAEQRGIEQGIEQGIEKGIEKGVAQGEKQTIKRTIFSMLKRGFSDDVIIDLLGLTHTDFNILKQYGGAETL